MSYYQYYRQQPGWGTSSYRIGAPPGPLFVPQPGWRGRHFYRAQAAGLQGELDQELFEHVWRDGKPHIGRRIVASEARKWHRRIYGGVEFPGRLLPHELGAAAGYEAFQQWAMYGQVYRPVLRGEKEREKEALAGMALGESAKLASLIVPGQNRKFHAEAGAIAIGVAWKLRKEAKEEGEEMEEAEEEAIGRRGGRPRLRKRRSSFTYGEVISSSDSDGERLEAANLAVPGRYPPMAGGAGLGLRSPVFGNTSYSPALSPQTATILPQSTGLVPQATGGAYQSGVSSNGQASIPSGHRRIQYVNSSGQPIQYVTSSGQPIVYVTPMGTGTNTAAAQPQYAQATQQPQYVVVPQSNMGSFAPGAGVGGAGYGVQPQYGVAGQQAGMMPGQQFAGMMPGQQAAGLMPGQQVAGLMPGQQAAGMMPGQQGYNLPQQQYTGLGAGYPAYGAAGQGYGRPRAYSVVNPPGGYDQRVF